MSGLEGVPPSRSSAVATLTGMLVGKGVEVVPDVPLGVVHRQGGRRPGWQERALRPPRRLPARRLGPHPRRLASATVWVSGDETARVYVKSKKAERIFLLGDNTNVPTSKPAPVRAFPAAHAVGAQPAAAYCGHGVGVAGRTVTPIASSRPVGFGKVILSLQSSCSWFGQVSAAVKFGPMHQLGELARPRQTCLPAHLLAHAAARPATAVGFTWSTRGKHMDALAEGAHEARDVRPWVFADPHESLARRGVGIARRWTVASAACSRRRS